MSDNRDELTAAALTEAVRSQTATIVAELQALRKQSEAMLAELRRSRPPPSRAA
jgi:hypothetical protein